MIRYTPLPPRESRDDDCGVAINNCVNLLRSFKASMLFIGNTILADNRQDVLFVFDIV